MSWMLTWKQNKNNSWIFQFTECMACAAHIYFVHSTYIRLHELKAFHLFEFHTYVCEYIKKTTQFWLQIFGLYIRKLLVFNVPTESRTSVVIWVNICDVHRIEYAAIDCNFTTTYIRASLRNLLNWETGNIFHLQQPTSFDRESNQFEYS